VINALDAPGNRFAARTWSNVSSKHRIRLSLRPSGTLDVLNFLELDFVISERAQIHRRHTFRALSFAINAPSAARFCSLRQAL
jgi:hypothetical protein